DLSSIRGTFRLLLPSTRVRVAVLTLAAVVAAGAGIALLVQGHRVVGTATALGVPLTAAFGWVVFVRSFVSRLLKGAGETARAIDVRNTPVDAEVKAAQAAEDSLRRQLADLKSGRRLARFAVERGATDDYRSHLGLVSRIHEDFERMSEILAGESMSPDGDAESSDLPRIDRIVLYIDDLDRCPPHR